MQPAAAIWTLKDWGGPAVPSVREDFRSYFEGAVMEVEEAAERPSATLIDAEDRARFRESRSFQEYRKALEDALRAFVPRVGTRAEDAATLALTQAGVAYSLNLLDSIASGEADHAD